MASRSPIQLGAELYGDDSPAADVEVIRLMLATLDAVQLQSAITLDLGHVGVYEAVLRAAELDDGLEQRVFDCLQRKSVPDLHVALAGVEPAAALLPLGLGAVLAALAWVVSRRGPPRRWDVPPGDFLHLLPRWRPRRLPDLAPGVSGLERLADLLVSTLASPRELSGALAGLVWLGLFALLLGALLLPW